MKKTILSLFILLSVNVFAQLSPRARFGIVNDTTDFGINIPKGSEVVDLKDSLIYLCVQSATEFDDLTSASVKFKWINGYTGDTANIAYLNQENEFIRDQIFNGDTIPLKVLKNDSLVLDISADTLTGGLTALNIYTDGTNGRHGRLTIFDVGDDAHSYSPEKDVIIGLQRRWGTSFWTQNILWDQGVKGWKIQNNSYPATAIEIGMEGVGFYTKPIGATTFSKQVLIMELRNTGVSTPIFADDPDTGRIIQPWTSFFMDMGDTSDARSWLGSVNPPIKIRSATSTDATLPLIELQRRTKGMGIRMYNADNKALELYRYSSDSAMAGVGINLIRLRGTYFPSASATVIAGDQLGCIRANGYDGTDIRRSSSLSFEVDGSPAGGAIPGKVVFRNNTNQHMCTFYNNGNQWLKGDLRIGNVLPVAANALGQNFIIGNTGNSMGMSILTSDVNYAGVVFGSVSSNRYADILGNYSQNALYIETKKTGGIIYLSSGNGVLSMTLAANQDVELAAKLKIGSILNSVSDTIVSDSSGYLKKRLATSLPIPSKVQDSLNNIYTQAQVTAFDSLAKQDLRVDMINHDSLVKSSIRTEYVNHDSVTKQTIRTEYINHDSTTKQTIRTEYVNHDSTAVQGLRVEMNNHDTLVRQYVRTWIDSSTVLENHDTLVTAHSKKIATKYDVATKTTTDSIPFIHNATRNSTYLRNSTDRVTLGSGATTANINRKLHVAGSMYLADTMFFPSSLYFFAYNGEYFKSPFLFNIGGISVTSYDVNFKSLNNDATVDSVLTLEVGQVKRTYTAPGALAIDTMKIVRTDQIDTLTQKLYLTGISSQDTAKRILGYNVATGEVKAMRYIHGVASADSLIEGVNNYITIGGTQYLYYKISTAGASSGGTTVRDTVGVLIQGDSCRILFSGHYKVRLWVAATTSNANDKIRVKIFTNNIPSATSLGRFLINSAGTGNQTTENYMWYKEFSANDWISFRVANITGARAIYISDMKFYIERSYD